MSSYRPVLGILLFSLLVGGCSNASDSNESPSAETEPRSPFGLASDRLPADSVASEMFMINGDASNSMGTWHIVTRPAMMDGRAVKHLILIQELQMGTMSDTLTVDAETLLPLRYHSDMPGMQTIRMNYGNNGHVSSEVIRGDAVTGIDTTITGPHLDAAEFALLIPALPLAPSYEASFPVVHYESGVDTTAVRVVGSDQVDYQGSMRDVWLVENDGQRTSTRYFVDKSSRRVLKTVTDMGNGRRFETVAR